LPLDSLACSIGRFLRDPLLRYPRAEAWATLVSFLGAPGAPRWADHILSNIEAEERIKELDGLGYSRGNAGMERTGTAL
jgi:hypothetical protein